VAHGGAPLGAAGSTNAAFGFTSESGGWGDRVAVAAGRPVAAEPAGRPDAPVAAETDGGGVATCAEPYGSGSAAGRGSGRFIR
jgi:hypothetical protein